MDHRASEKLINSYAWKTLRRLHNAGIRSMSLEDLKQEMWCAWCKARDTYNPEFGVPFLAYLAGGLKRYAMGLTQRQGYARIQEEWAKSLSQPLGDENDATLADVLPSADPSLDDTLGEKQALEIMERRVSERTKTFLRILHDQPVEVMDELHKAEARSAWAAELNVRNVHHVGLTTGMVFKIMGASRPERTQILEEVRELGEYMTERV